MGILGITFFLVGIFVVGLVSIPIAALLYNGTGSSLNPDEIEKIFSET